MAINLHNTTDSVITPFGANVLQDVYLEKKFISNLKKNIVCVPLGQKSTLPMYSGKVCRWQFFSVPTARTSQTEGIDVANSTNFTTTPVSATLAEFAGVSKYSRMLLDTAVEGTKDEIADNLAYEAALSYDTTAIQAVDGTSQTRDAGTSMTAEDIRKSAEGMRTRNVRPHRATPGGQFYCGIFSPEAAYDAMGEGAPAWFQAKSSDYEQALTRPFEDTPATAALYGVMIKLSTNVQQAASEDQNVIIGDEAFGYSSLETDAIKPRPIFTDPESNIAAPVRNYGYIGWWGLFAAVLFDNNRAELITSDVT